MEDLRYPIGKFQAQESYSAQETKAFIARIEALPGQLEEAIGTLSAEQMNTPYREGGWSLRQVVHHVADSHMNSYIRIKWTLTESTPVIKAYDEKAWANTADYQLDASVSMHLIKALHAKWTGLMKTLSAEDLRKEFTHPETKKNVPLDRLIHLYAWHGEHHLAHITSLKKRMGWK